MSDSKDIAVKDQGPLSVSTGNTGTALLMGRLSAILEEQGPRDMDESIQEILLGGQDFLGNEALSAEDVLGIPLRIGGFTPNPSDYGIDQSYATIYAERLDTHEKIVVNCGGMVVLAQLVRAYDENALPFVAQFFQGKKRNAERNPAYRLIRVPGNTVTK